ncbi:MAG: TIGR02300 family protein, partial [Rhizomicrobium sp.]
MANDPTFETRLHAGSTTLVKADLGIKRVCPSCGARFYDLQKRPIECPKCAFSFEPESLYKQRRPRQPEPQAAEPV